ncbi:unnamed protein product [Ixodes pacificus]
MPVARRHVIPEPTDVPIRVRVSVQVTHYASPTKLFLRYNFDDSNNDGVPSPAPGVPHVYEVHIGMFCLVFQEKSQRFLRAQVIDVHKNLSGIQVSAEILYVDRGNADMIGLDCVFPITRKVSSKPNMTAPCCIRKVRPTSRSSRLDLQRVSPHSQVLFDAIFYGMSDAGVYDVDLFVRDPKVQPTNRLNVAELLVQHGFAELLRYLNVTAPTDVKTTKPLMNGKIVSNHRGAGALIQAYPEADSNIEYTPCIPSRLPRTTVPEESSFEVEVTFTCSPDLWYGQLVGLRGRLTEIQRNITGCDLEPCDASEVRKGSYYIYGDLTVQSAVRVRVEDLEKAGSHFQTRVFFVDYGNRKTVSSSCLYKMDAKLAQQGPLALRFQLAGVEPWNAWTDIDVNRFAQLTHSESPLVALVTGKEKSSGDYGDYIFVVSLKSRTEGEIAERLIRDGHARAPSQRESLIKRIDRSAIEDFSPMNEDYHNSFNSYKVETDNPGVPIADFAVKDESRICKFLSAQGYCRQDEYCICNHVLGEKDSMILHVKEEVPTCMATLKLPKEGSTALAQVSYAVSPSNFYLVLPYGHKSIQKLIEKGPSASKDRFESLMKTLQVTCSCSSFNEDRLLRKSEGELVAARSRGDERWYRAKVVGVSTERNAVRVAFPDFGDEEWVSASWVKMLETRFLRLPFQAVQACLADVEPKGSGRECIWSTEACAAFVESTAGKDLLAEVVGYSKNLMQVKLHFCESGKLHSVSSCLVSSWQIQLLKQQRQSSASCRNMPCPA